MNQFLSTISPEDVGNDKGERAGVRGNRLPDKTSSQKLI
jgi:hypothetical protein